ncbi:nitric oxide reductase transcriptional regulator NorR [Pseudomonas chlororaphis]|uniref:Nitric oxide reductase Fis family transcriptional regulator n=1 Tax=Pseudomonas chlororaphis TaxID=587753 RepID=A0AAX3FPL1_9PSED|nr:nitric oxide reductase transcriptional regulator NorR [Pseudomonas chlororaphis]AZC38007.1 Anaerobic nitric oxide reductase transcription regulator NorR [Pseudomonas chlororaphis subsp. piscium]AZC44553.1 Anaerobic nitric oxide reductase transcription regulator NorR [Pseudomonas chlororaphis subsp. piscium]WDG70181.1 nitric oxide reductase transcriptional regulator NorR [Pseudomonas chlororaphis]WDH32033.1 nitric oxide reductase transcriptional regulator NorR [Pseudomonas chlororaphis]WDH68
MLRESLAADLIVELPNAVRLQRLVQTLREYFKAGAVGLLRLDDDSLRPLATVGLVHEALGRRFVIAQHPRLAAIMASREPTWFEPDSRLPDPYDGLLDHPDNGPLAVHDCMGVSLYVEGRVWGAITLDALRPGTFDRQARDELKRCSLQIEAALRVTRLEQENRSLRLSRSEPQDARGPVEEGEILGQSEVLHQLLNELDVLADSELPVLLLGETGVGKELFARRLHRLSRRAHKPLVQVNCAALPESLAESELFGHVKGAFSGATSDRAGRFDAANGGTLFLDEVGELPLSVQAKLLRTLQNGEIQRLGADKPLHVDVRIIAATNRHLPDSIRDGLFRADLYHRLSVYPVPIPPLRERGPDVLVLAGHFLELNRSRLGLRGLRLSPAAERALLAYPWPGNVRELEHVISRAALKQLSRGGSRSQILTLEPDVLDLDSSVKGAEPSGQPPEATVDGPFQPLSEAVDDCQRQKIHQALSRCRNNWARAARLLEVDPSNLHKLARRLRLK